MLLVELGLAVPYLVRFLFDPFPTPFHWCMWAYCGADFSFCV